MKNLLLFILLTIACSTFAEDLVTNVQAYQSGKEIIITYNLKKDAQISISVSYEDKGKRTARILCNDNHKTNGMAGDIGFVKKGSDKKVIWNVLESEDSFQHDNVQFTVTAKVIGENSKLFVLGEYGYSPTPQHSGGLTIGWIKTYGTYIKFRSNYKGQLVREDIYDECFENGLTRNDELPFYTGNIYKRHFIIDAGFCYDIFRNRHDDAMLTFCIGMGYGHRILYWHCKNADYGSRYYIYNPTSYKGFSGDISVMGAYKGITFMFGLNTINFKYLDLEFGFGYSFSIKGK